MCVCVIVCEYNGTRVYITTWHYANNTTINILSYLFLGNRAKMIYYKMVFTIGI